MMPSVSYRITPAYAGNTQLSGAGGIPIWDHPRLRGEHLFRIFKDFFRMGSPPLTRGTPVPRIFLPFSSRITPAYAGNTHSILKLFSGFRDHPRLRGEHDSTLESSPTRLGSPPLTRGTLIKPERRRRQQRITPAYAGNTPCDDILNLIVRDHPRLRGEHLLTAKLIHSKRGSPPLTRGTQ